MVKIKYDRRNTYNEKNGSCIFQEGNLLWSSLFRFGITYWCWHSSSNPIHVGLPFFYFLKWFSEIVKLNKRNERCMIVNTCDYTFPSKNLSWELNLIYYLVSIEPFLHLGHPIPRKHGSVPLIYSHLKHWSP